MQRLSKKDEDRNALRSKIEDYNIKYVLDMIVKNIPNIKRLIYSAKQSNVGKYVYAQVNLEEYSDRLFSTVKIEPIVSLYQFGSAESVKLPIDIEQPVIVILYKGAAQKADIVNLTPDKVEKIKTHLGGWSEIPQDPKIMQPYSKTSFVAAAPPLELKETDAIAYSPANYKPQYEQPNYQQYQAPRDPTKKDEA